MTHFKYLSLSTFFVLTLLKGISQTKDSIYSPIRIPTEYATRLSDTTKLCLCCRHRGDTSKMPLTVIDKWIIITPSIAQIINLINYKNIIDVQVYSGNDTLAKSYGDKAKYGLIIMKLNDSAKLVTLKQIFKIFEINKNDQKLKVCINKNLIEPTDIILIDPTASFNIEVIFDKYWIYGKEIDSEEKFLNFVTKAQ